MRVITYFIIVLISSTIFTTNLKGQNAVIAPYAGTGVRGYSGDGGPAILAKLDTPESVALDKYGNLYIGDGVWIRKVDPSGIITTIAGNGSKGFSGDGGPATAAELIWPMSITVDDLGNIYFGDSSRIRKINTAGIISTLAGSAFSGHSGDGGPSTAANLFWASSIVADHIGNIYFADAYDNRIRVIDAAGIINTIAGTGTIGYAGDGLSATVAELNTPWGVAFDAVGNMYIADAGNNRIRKINSAGIISTIAGDGIPAFYGDGRSAIVARFNYPRKIAIDKIGNVYVLDNFSRVRQINANDGKINTIMGNGVSAYKGNGGFATSAEFNSSDFAIDTSDNIYLVERSQSIVRKAQQTANIGFYIDGNNNCVIDNTDATLGSPVTVEIDSNGIVVDTVSAINALGYNTKGKVGDIYTFKIIQEPSGLWGSCPSGGMLYDTINSLVGNYFTKSMAFQCISSGVDLGLHTSNQFTRGQHQGTYIFPFNKFCALTNGTVTATFSPKYVFIGYADPSPSSIIGNTLSWDIVGLSAYSPIKIYYRVEVDPALVHLTMGDTVHSFYTITPTAGDPDLSDNTVVRVDTVTSSYDPNEISVSPGGCLPGGDPVQLQYTINFENTGNDTAFNIYVMDSLSDNLNPQSFRIVAASATMNTTRIYSGGHAIIKFDFPNINLLDSSHHGQCDGTIIYTINTKAGLPKGSTIFNQAGIYFDYNKVVETNVVENIVDCSGLGITTLSTKADASIFPNPPTDELTIKMDKGAYSSCTVTNSIGQLMLQQQLSSTQTKLNIKSLPAGLYYITLRGENGTKVQKFVKL